VRFGMPLPDRIANAPELFFGSEFYYNCFLELTSSRAVGMGVGPISYLSMLEYCVLNDITGEQRDDLLWIVQKLDSKYLKWSTDNGSERVQPKNETGGKKG